MQDVIDKFIEEINRKMLSKNTYITYTTALLSFKKFCEDKNLDWKTRDAVYQYSVYLSKLGLNANSVNLKLCALSSFFNFCIDNGIAEKNYAKRLKVRAPKRIVPTIDKDTCDLLLETTPEPYLSVIKLMLYGGLRISEAVSVDSKNFYYDGSVFCKLIGKGNKERITPIMDKNASQFLTYKKPDKLTEGMVKEYLYRWSKKYGKHVTAHRLRHTFATNCIEKGIPVEIVSEWLGHNDLRTTMIYVKISYERIKKFVKENI